MKTCPKGTVWSSDTKSMADAGYNIQAHVYLTNLCLPMPCKWFFSESGKSYFNNKNKHIDSGCVCDFENGWIPTLTSHACIPIFNETAHITHSAATIDFVREPQTLHQYVYDRNISSLASHITNILENINTKEASKNFLFNKNSIKKQIVIAGEFGKNSFLLSSRNAKKIMKAISMHGVLSDTYYDLGKLDHCSNDNTNLFCSENNYLLMNESVAFEKAIGGLHWEFLNDALKIYPLSQSEYLRDMELTFTSH